MENIKTINRGEALADYIANFDYGTVVHYQDIEMITKEKYGTTRYYNFVQKAKKLLEKRGKMIKSIGSGNYQVLYPGDYSSAYSREVRCARNRIKHGGKILAGAPVNDMTDAELITHNHVADFHATLEARMCGEFVTVKRLTNKTHPFSQENIQHG